MIAFPTAHVVILALGTACHRPVPASASEVVPRILPLRGEAAAPEREFSGMAWCGDQLLLLPQYPHRSDGHLFALDAAEVHASLSEGTPLTPRRLPVADGGAADLIPGFEGFEALACAADGTAWVTVEASPETGMTGWLLPGQYSPTTGITLRPTARIALPSRSQIANKSDEALWIWQGQPWTLHEVNAQGAAVAYHLDAEGILQTAPAPVLPFRVTDATPPDPEGHLWLINYQWEGDRGLRLSADPILDRWGYGPTHAQVSGQRAERLLAVRVTDAGVLLDDRPPLQLALGPEGRNWEGIAPFAEGVLLITDQHPETILAYVPLPSAP